MGTFYKNNFTAKSIHRRFVKCDDGLWRIELSTPTDSNYVTNRSNEQYTGRTLKELRYKYMGISGQHQSNDPTA